MSSIINLPFSSKILFFRNADIGVLNLKWFTVNFFCNKTCNAVNKMQIAEL